MTNHIVLLAGDIGGTKTNFGLYVPIKSQWTTFAEETYPSKNYPDFEHLISDFLQKYSNPQVSAACFGVAGPVVNESCKTTNLPWVVDTSELQQLLNCNAVSLINDMQAQGLGIFTLPPQDLVALTPLEVLPKLGNKAVIAAGTGLGETLLYWDGNAFKSTASEGGAVEFAPRGKLQMELLSYLSGRFNHVSYERVLSGQGLLNIYSFLRESGYGEEPTWLKERLDTSKDPSATISTIALANENPLCVETLDLFAAIYGAEAGNLALTFMALGGIYVGGGIAYKIIDKLKDGTFLRAFYDKGTFSDLMTSIPVYVISNPKVGLWGAVQQAKSSLIIN